MRASIRSPKGWSGDIRVTTRLRRRRPVHRPARRAARDRARDVRPGDAHELARPAGGARSGHGAGGEPVAAARDDRRPQRARSCATCCRCCRSTSRVSGPEWESENLYRTLTPRAAQPDPRGCRRDDLSAAHHAALRASRSSCWPGELAVRDLPEAWNSGMEQRFGARPSGRRRRLPAGHALGAGLVRLLSRPMRWAGDRRAALGSAAGAVAGGRAAARARRVRRRVRLAARERARLWAPRCRSRS